MKPTYRKVEDKPPWDAGGDDKEKRRMYEWVCSRLDDLIDRHEWFGTEIDIAYEQALEEAADETANEAAALQALLRYGDPEPLRILFPAIAQAINRPKREPGKHWEKRATFEWDDPQVRLRHALIELRFIREIWKDKEIGYGRSHRPPGQPTAEEIAAERWGLEIDEVHNKQLSRKRLAELKKS